MRGGRKYYKRQITRCRPQIPNGQEDENKGRFKDCWAWLATKKAECFRYNGPEWSRKNLT